MRKNDLSYGHSHCNNAFLRGPSIYRADNYYFQESIAQIFSFLPTSVKKIKKNLIVVRIRTKALTLFVFPTFTPPPATTSTLSHRNLRIGVLTHLCWSHPLSIYLEHTLSRAVPCKNRKPFLEEIDTQQLPHDALLSGTQLHPHTSLGPWKSRHFSKRR
jgi:hypothetical protein